MSATLFDESWASIELDEDLYPRDAVQGAAYVFHHRPLRDAVAFWGAVSVISAGLVPALSIRSAAVP